MSLARDITDMGMGGASAMFATLFTNPIEVVKTRLQLQGELRTNHAVYYRSVPHGLYVIARNEGVVALQRGLSAMLGFQFFLNTFRLGMFRICERRGLTAGRGGRTSVVKGAAAAGAGGALGSVAGTPFFLVKTRLQAQAAKAISVGHQHKHTGTFEALADIYAKEGFKGLFRGVQPQIPRGAVGSASQMVSFSYAKESLVSRGWLTESPLLLSFCGANLGGLVMTVCLNPFDVVATRLSNQRKYQPYRVARLDRSVWDIYQEDGRVGSGRVKVAGSRWMHAASDRTNRRFTGEVYVQQWTSYG
ncbi:hypothetical protein MSG28_003136 [Choristoneura fumiferana]|uniref:Uncharacterized protein n=1 Tax=Choristoneura fumiferana TaxID=7141 RepID=A0ACC0KDR3_CHOFU|nr:hypothetical protein MSG28_003136 [Choristoneura fumiferana]